MAKSRIRYVCQACGAVSTRWAGRCDACGAWNTIVEEAAGGGVGGAPAVLLPKRPGRIVPLVSLDGDIAESPRLATGIAELDRVTGGGFVEGSALLVGGDPGSANRRC